VADQIDPRLQKASLSRDPRTSLKSLRRQSNP
jgi:hypothetical protein